MERRMLVRRVGLAKLLDMRSGYAPVRNVLGMSDPCVVWLDGRWTMFIGGMGFGFKTNILTARLPEGDPLDSDDWEFVMADRSRSRARWIVDQPARGSWNRCMHSVCYVAGEVDGRPVERIYHAGRTAETVLSTRAPYRIGFLERQDGEWTSRPAPIEVQGLRGVEGVLEPKVEYADGFWHMRYLALTDVGDDKNGKHTILYSRSRDGETGWSAPVVFSDAAVGFYDSVVKPVPDDGGFLLALTRDSNLFGKQPYPSQGIWLSRSASRGIRLEDWPEPDLILDPEEDEDGWYRGGMCSPSLQWSDPAQSARRLHVFFVAAAAHVPWAKRALSAFRERRLPPVPAPFFFTIGRLDLKIEIVAPSF